MTMHPTANAIRFDTALLPQGWARDVRITLAGSRIASVVSGAAPQPGDIHHAIGIPGLPNLHSHAFQRGMAGLSEARGPAADSFWTWREVMYCFLDRMTPDDVEAVAAQAYAEMLEGGFTRVGEFHYLHHQPDGAPYADPAEIAARIAAAAGQTGIGLMVVTGLRPGATADLIALDAEHPALMARDGDRLLDGWIFAAATSPVSAVWAGGRQVVAEGHHVARDRLHHDSTTCCAGCSLHRIVRCCHRNVICSKFLPTSPTSTTRPSPPCPAACAKPARWASRPRANPG